MLLCPESEGVWASQQRTFVPWSGCNVPLANKSVSTHLVFTPPAHESSVICHDGDAIAKIHSSESPSPTNGARAPSRTNESGTENKTMAGRKNTPHPKKPSPKINLGRRRQNHSARLSSDRSTSSS